MSCALASPENGVCANRRPVRGRQAQVPAPPAQAALVPLSDGHAARQPSLTPAATTAPFATTAPESTFSLAEVRADAAHPGAAGVVEARPALVTAAPGRPAPPSFREIRAGRAAAAARAPVAEVRIAVPELEDGPASGPSGQVPLPGMEQLVERVRQRTAARLSRSGSLA